MNWKNEAMDKLRRYDAMRQALRNIPAEIERLEDGACTLRGVSTDITPVRGGGGRREEALIENLMERQELEWTLGDNNRLMVEIPEGTRGELRVWFAGKRIWRAAECVSFIAALGLAVLALRRRHR